MVSELSRLNRNYLNLGWKSRNTNIFETKIGAKKKCIKVVVYPSYNDIHDIILSEISSQRSRH